jgi:hypothetical protein
MIQEQIFAKIRQNNKALHTDFAGCTQNLFITHCKFIQSIMSRYFVCNPCATEKKPIQNMPFMLLLTTIYTALIHFMRHIYGTRTVLDAPPDMGCKRSEVQILSPRPAYIGKLSCFREFFLYMGVSK